MARYMTAATFLILAIVSGQCLKLTKDHRLKFPQVAFGSIFFNSLLGFIIWVQADVGFRFWRAYNISNLCVVVFSLPCITTVVWLQNGYRWEYAYAHSVFGIIPLLGRLGDGLYSYELVDVIVTVNMISLGYVSYLARNTYGVAAAVVYAVNELSVLGDDLGGLWVQDTVNLMMCVYSYLALRAIGGHM